MIRIDKEGESAILFCSRFVPQMIMHIINFVNPSSDIAIFAFLIEEILGNLSSNPDIYIYISNGTQQDNRPPKKPPIEGNRHREN